MPNTWNATTIQFLTQPELRAFFRVITRKRDRALFLVAYRHGLRASEVGLLHLDGLNFAQQRLTIHRLKRSLAGIYPLRADEVTALKAYLRERQSPSPTLFEVWQRFAGKWATSTEQRLFMGKLRRRPTGKWDADRKLQFSARQLRESKAL